MLLHCCSLGLGEDTSRFLFQQLILALDYCHKMNISNRHACAHRLRP